MIFDVFHGPVHWTVQWTQKYGLFFFPIRAPRRIKKVGVAIESAGDVEEMPWSAGEGFFA
jgi:hypothetical protein